MRIKSAESHKLNKLGVKRKEERAFKVLSDLS